MSSQVYDIDTINYPNDWNSFVQFHINNTFYLLAPDYYYHFYINYLAKCINVYDGWLAGIHNSAGGYIPQKMLQSISRGLNDMLFAGGIDFSCDNDDDYGFITKWAKKHRGSFYRAVKKARLDAFAGGTSILKLNRRNGELYCTAHRIDTWYADMTPDGEITSIKIYGDVIDAMNKNKDALVHYGICEERYFNEQHIPCVKASVYASKGLLQTSVMDRPTEFAKNINWENLPADIKQIIKRDYPSVMIGEEQYLPFKDSLGVVLIRNTDDIPNAHMLPFGQPIGDMLMTESLQYDQLKFFEREEIYLARARALVPEEFWNKDDPLASDRTLDDRFYQQVSSSGDQVTPVQFEMRAEKIKVMRENILKDTAFKLNVSASTVASFLDDGTGAMTATQIINEKTKTDTWIKSNVKLIEPEINELLRLVMNYYGKTACEVIIKSEGQSPFLEKLKTCSDVFTSGNMSPKTFVNNVYNNLSQEEREKEIKWLEEKAQMDREMHDASIGAWQQQPQQ